MRPDRSFQGLILALQRFWADQGCVILQPYDMEMGAGTFHPATTLRALGPKPWKAAYVQPSRRPKDGRYGENPNRLQHYYQFQVIIKPSPPDLQELYLKSLAAIGIDSASARHPLCRGRLGKPDARCVGARVGVLVRRHGSVAVHLFPAGRGCRMRSGRRRTHLRVRAARLYLQGVDRIWISTSTAATATRRSRYGDVFLQAEQEYSRHNFEYADTAMLFEQFRMAEQACRKYLDVGWKNGSNRQEHLMALPAYDQCIKASHVFNLLDARGVISVTERQSYIMRVRELAKACGEAWVHTEAGGAA